LATHCRPATGGKAVAFGDEAGREGCRRQAGFWRAREGKQMTRTSTNRAGIRPAWVAVAAMGFAGALTGGATAVAQDTLSNACPVDGCAVKIVDVRNSGDELALTFEANFMPDMSKNHIHVWWGENFTIEQVSNDAETVHNVKQGEWHPTADYPSYVTQSAVSTSVRGAAKTICVSAADRNHDILDVTVSHCMDVGDHL
jgi:hypothetical protein